MLPPAPGRFSAITCWPSALVSWSAITRARMSVDCPGGKGTMILIGLDGHCWARAGAVSEAAAEATSSRRVIIESLDVHADRGPGGPRSGRLSRLLVLLRRMFAGD